MGRSDHQLEKKNRYYFDDSPTGKGSQTAHAHFLDGKRLLGTSSALGIIDKSNALIWWASSLAVNHLGWVSPKIPGTSKKVPMAERLTPEYLARYNELIGMDPATFLEQLDFAYKAHSVKLEKAADDGTDLHAQLESYVKYCIVRHGSVPLSADEYVGSSGNEGRAQEVAMFANWAVDNVKQFIASEGYCYSERLKTGGIVDLAFEDMDDNYVLLDFKSSKAAYDTHFFQNAGYAIAIEENGIFTQDGELIRKMDKPFSYFLVLAYGMPEPVPQRHPSSPKLKDGETPLGEDIQRCKAAFEAAVNLHRLCGRPLK
jgi:uncharacterized protein (DUF1330 family)